jgi:glyoxylase-like metal-dependent hydrolase (beta-lactamase superfamily II)
MRTVSTDWYESGVSEVAAGVHRIPLPLPDDGLRAVNTYVIEDGAGVVLVDPGQWGAQSRSELAKGLATLGSAFVDVRRCLVTHLHRDHYTNSISLRREVGCQVSLGGRERAGIAAVRGSTTYGIDPQLRALPSCGAGFLVDLIDVRATGHDLPNDIWEQPDDWLEDGDVIELESRVLQVAHTPGHTAGHVTFRDPDAGLLFSGDHVLPRITPSISFEPITTDLPLADYLESLAGTAREPDALLAAAHGPVTAGAHQRVAELLAHHELRLELTEDQVRRGARSVYEVAQRLRWTRRERELSTLDPVNMMLAVMETKAHLDVLVRDGSVERDHTAGLLRYSPRDGGSAVADRGRTVQGVE